MAAIVESLFKIFWTCESTKGVWIAFYFSPPSVFHCHFTRSWFNRRNARSLEHVAPPSFILLCVRHC